jgi:hypothetical protein
MCGTTPIGKIQKNNAQGMISGIPCDTALFLA